MRILSSRGHFFRGGSEAFRWLRQGMRLIATALAMIAISAMSQCIATPQIQVGNLRVELERIVTGAPSDLGFTVFMDTPNDGTDRKFFAELGGITGTQARIRTMDKGQLSTFLDLTEEVFYTGETGLLGFTFHPGFADPNSPGYRKLYTQYSTNPNPDADIDFPASGNIHHHNVLVEWQVDANNPNQVDVSTRREIFREAHITNVHAGGMLEFGPDGYLYGAIGTPIGGNNPLWAQDNSKISGTIYRIDPVAPELTPTSTNVVSANGKYRIPSSNPYVGDPAALYEIFASGVRSPYRFSIDPVTGLMFLGDVGEGLREEISVVPIGGNMGWPYREGSAGGLKPTPNPAPEMINPIAEYTHEDGISIIGGYVYRGSIPELQGKYIFGDLGFGPLPRVFNKGRLFWIDPYDEMGELKDSTEIRIQELATGTATCADVDGDCTFEALLTSFAVDDDGELYAIGLRYPNVAVYKFVSAYFLPEGDYNQDGIVDAADYTVWRDSVGSTTDLRANGDDTGTSFGVIDEADYAIWKANFGAMLDTIASGTLPVPEPVSIAMALSAVLPILVAVRSRRA